MVVVFPLDLGMMLLSANARRSDWPAVREAEIAGYLTFMPALVFNLVARYRRSRPTLGRPARPA